MLHRFPPPVYYTTVYLLTVYQWGRPGGMLAFVPRPSHRPVSFDRLQYAAGKKGSVELCSNFRLDIEKKALLTRNAAVERGLNNILN